MAAAGEDVQQQTVAVDRGRVNDALGLNPLAVLVPGRHLINRDLARQGQNTPAQNANIALAHFGSEVARAGDPGDFDFWPLVTEIVFSRDT